MRMVKSNLMVIVVLSAMLLSACQVGAQPSGGSTDTAVPSIEEQPIQAPEQELGSTDKAPQDSSIPTQAMPTSEVRPSPRSELEATDPTTVNLAAGIPTLVEFFAFW